MPVDGVAFSLQAKEVLYSVSISLHSSGCTLPLYLSWKLQSMEERRTRMGAKEKRAVDLNGAYYSRRGGLLIYFLYFSPVGKSGA